MKTYYTVYRITNRVNGRFYIGSHRTKELDDGYMGSGKLLKRAFKKYGIDNFDKEILAIFDTSKEMFAEESRLVDKDNPKCYNLKEGGNGGFDHLNDGSPKSIDRCRKAKISMQQSMSKKAYSELSRKGGKIASLIQKEKKMNFYDPNFDCKGFLGKAHTQETKQKIGKANKIKQSGEKNSQYNTIWITNGVENMKIKKAESIPDGWNRGRTIGVPRSGSLNRL